MAGHSKWSKIKRKKGVADQKKGKVFTRCIYEITVAVKEGDGVGDPAFNPRLRTAIDKAKSVNMPIDNIERAIKKATGEIKGDDKLELTYEGYGPHGVAIMLEVLTENKNRTVGEIRHAFSKCGGALGENGCVGWMFNKKGIFLFPKSVIEEDSLMELALNAGAEDILTEEVDGEHYWEVTTPPHEFYNVRHALETKVKEFEVSELQYVPTNRVPVSGEHAEKVEKLVEMLEDLEDILSVSANYEIK